ncbi:MAG: pyridoxamine 5'-phosphate oxidase family protein [Bacteroidales bacterium]|nr:pyridoxamine 5'-phosphate oxidase family protein [Lentimicrobiaceae bacterium]MDD5693781.1 pyridoxamine 5'-phosphate oxidase family protein [Bacteroidales bacterium]
MKSRTIESPQAIYAIINQCEVCHVGMVDTENKPYVLPFNFGFEEGIIYLHSAPQGKKINILQQNDHVCIAFSSDYVLRYQHADVACSWSMKYRSVLAYGRVEFIEDLTQKARVLNVIMKKYAGREFSYNQPALVNVKVYRVVVSRFEGKAYGY